MVIRKKFACKYASYVIACCFILALPKQVKASRSVSKYFPMLESNFTSHLYKSKKNNVSISGMYAAASTGFKRGGGSSGLSELWGEYDLDHVIKALEAAQGASPNYINPIRKVTGSMDFADKSIKFRVDEKMKAVGLSLSYIHWFFDNSWFIGAWLPIMHMQGMTRYTLRKNSLFDLAQLSGHVGARGDLPEAERKKIDRLTDRIRREAHQAIGFYDNAWSQGGLGDLDVFLGYRYYLDHEFLMRSINILPKIGIMAPTGIKRDPNNPSSIPLMGDGHWGAYGEIHAQFELKQDLRVGLFASGIYQFEKTKEERISFFKEPAIFSPLKGSLRVRPGATAMISPYLALENVVNGLNFQAKYTYLRHAADKVKDVRLDKSIPSYLTKTAGAGVTQEDIASNIAHKRNLTKWRSHYISLQLMFDSSQALANWKMSSNFYVNYDIPFGGNGISKTHQVTVGAALHF